jgi:hypothetical protein
MKLRILILGTTLLANFLLMAGGIITPTDSIKIMGKIKNGKVFSLEDLDTFPKTVIKDQIIYNHKGEVKDTLIKMKGISLKTILASIQYLNNNPKELNEFYFVFVASDGYKVVFSWNEIYNTEAGNNFFIVTEIEGKQLKYLDQRIAFISTTDLKTGRRYIKGLSKIEVKQIE